MNQGQYMPKGLLPYAMANAYKGSDQTVIDSTKTAITWSGEKFDHGDILDIGAHNTRITIPDGVDYMQCTGQLSINASAQSGWFQLFMDKNGSNDAESKCPLIYSSLGTNISTMGWSIVYPIVAVTAGDYYEMIMYQYFGGNIKVTTYTHLNIIMFKKYGYA